MQKRRIKKKTLAKRLTALLLAMVMVIGVAFQYTETVQAAISTSADSDTSSTYDDDNFLGHEYSTEFAGRIWTDKTVTTAENNEFTVKYSALATSKSVTGQTNAPLDVVFVIDTSGSMDDDMSSSDNTRRIVAAVDALNASIEKVMGINEYTRVGVVAFSNTAQVLLELGRYEKGTRTYTSGRQSVTVNDYFAVNGTTLYTQVIPEGTTTQYNASRNVTGGTNIQHGYYTALNELATAGTTTANINGQTLNRVPALIFLSDGAPTYSSSSTNWWEPAANNGNGPGSNPSDTYFIGNGMKALMTAAYMKEAVNRNYAEDLSIYTVGMGISGLTGYEQNLAYITLAPNDNWNATNNVASDFRSAWATYITNDGTPSVNVGARNNNRYTNAYYTITHPTGTAAQYDIDTDVDALKNLVTDYYDADDAATVTNVFDTIVSNIAISAPEVPTEVKTDQTLVDGGYLTYTDPIGKYMEVKGTEMTFQYWNEATSAYDSFTVSDTDGDGVYTFADEATVVGSDGVSYQLNNIRITLTEDTDGNQILEVKIPAALIPLRVNSVTLNPQGQVTSHTHNGELPCTLSYKVGLVPEIYDAEANTIRLIPGNMDGTAWSDEELAAYHAYIEENTDVNGLVNFYSNLYTGTYTILNNKTGEQHTAGDAIVTFEPSHTNGFYYIQENMWLFNNEAMTEPTVVEKLDDETTYYYKEIYYHEDDVIVKAVARTGAQLKAVTTEKDDETGQWYRVPGTVRKNKLQLFENTKNPNTTGTAEDYYASEYVGEGMEGHFMVHLGNNGVLKAKITGNLAITKVVTADAGLTAPEKEFTFTVELGTTDTYSYRIEDASGNVIGTGQIADGGTIVLMEGQTAVVANLPADAAYKVTEAAVAGFETTAVNAEGKIVSGATAEAVFTNNYNVENIIVNEDGEATDFGVKKVLTGREWNSDDEYTFIMESTDLVSPMPEGAWGVPTETPTHYLIEKTVKSGEEVTFGEIVYSVPGTYIYTISERVATPGIAGVSYSGAMYQVTVVITDNGDGTLSKAVTMTQLRNDQGTADGVDTFTGATAVFTNTFSADQVEWTPVGTKDYTDNSGTNPLVNDMFSFQMSVNENSPANTPMPTSAVNGVTTDMNIGTQIGFDSITFTKEHIVSSEPNVPTTYLYDFKEVIPVGAEYIGNEQWSLNGMVYDGATYTVAVDVYYNDNMEIVVEPHYYVTIQGVEYNRVVFFNVYTPEEVTLGEDGYAPLQGVKTLTGRNWKTGDTFTFELSTDDMSTQAAIDAETIGATVPSAVTSATQEFSFDNITFTKPGTYKFQIKEVAGALGGVTYDTHVTNVNVVVTDVNGELVAEVTYDNSAALTDADKALTDKAAFTNTYEAADSEPISLAGTKTLTGRDMINGEFFLNVEPQDNAPMGDSNHGNAVPASANGVESAAITLLNNIVYTEPGTYVYLIRENIPSDAQKLGGITYDDTLYRITVTVRDNTNGKLVAIPAVEISTDNGESWSVAAKVTFNNTYKADPVTYSPIHLWKELDGMELEAGDFQFEASIIGNSDGIENADAYPETVGNLASGEIVFSDITFTKAGTYQFKIKEVLPVVQNPGMTYSTNELVVQFIVTDNGYGNLEVARGVVSGDIIFTNTYETEGTLDGEANLTVVKEFTGRTNNEWLESDAFRFVLVPSNSAAEAGVLDGTIDMNADGPGIPQSMMLTISDAAEAEGKAFSDIVFTKAGVYEFSLYEESVHPETGVAIPGVNYDTSIRTITVTAVDNGDGTMSVNAVVTGGTGLTFENVYDTSSTVVSGRENLQVTKALVGREWKEGETFTFTLEAADDTTRQAIANKVVEFAEGFTSTITMTEENQRTLNFADIIFHEVGTYKFVITENRPTENPTDGLTYDVSGETVTVEVVDDQTGGLVADVSYGADSDADEINFVNTYEASGSTSLTINKVLEGRDWLETDEFTFEVLIDDAATEAAVASGDIVFPGDNGNIATYTITSVTENHAFTSEPILFNQVGSYKFIVREVTSTPIKGIIYDATIHEVVVNVTDDELDGTLEIEVVGGNTLTFTNTYDADSAKLTGHDNLAVQKNFTGRENNIWLETDVFKFTLAPGDEVTTAAVNAGKIEFTETVLEITSANKGHAHFGDVIFHEAGRYTFIVTELSGNADNGITYDATARTVVVDVLDNQEEGVLEVQLNRISEPLVFRNTYSTAPVTYEPVTLMKELTGKTLADGEFTFKLEAVANPENGMVLPEVVEVTNNADGEIVFGSLTFTKPGTYQVKVSEVVPTEKNPGMTYSKNELIVQFVITDNHLGELELVREVISGETTFTNNYETVGTLVGATNLKVLKNFTGRANSEWLAGDAFGFVLVPANEAAKAGVQSGIVDMNGKAEGTPSIMTLVISADDTEKAKAFSDIIFTAPGVYTFNLYEETIHPVTKETIQGVNYDTALRTITVTAIDNGDGSMTVTSEITGGTGFIFNNIYDADTTIINGWDDLQVTKTLIGREWKEGETFTFTLEAADDITLQAIADKVVEFAEGFTSTITMTKENQNTLSFADIVFHEKGTYTFVIREVAPEGVTKDGLTYDTYKEVVTIEVTDNQVGELVSTISYDTADGDDIHFKNTYDASGSTELVLNKVLEGREWLAEDEFEFEVTAGDEITSEAVKAGTIKFTEKSYTVNAAKQSVTTDTVVFEETGTYKFKVREVNDGIPGIVYDEEVREVVVIVTDENLDGTFEVEVEGGNALTFTNKYKPDAGVLSGQQNLGVQKNFTGRADNEWLSSDVFNFVLVPADEITIAALNAGKIELTRSTLEISAANKDNAYFGDIIFHEVGAYSFVVTEIAGALDDGISYDTSVYTIVVNVTNDYTNGTLVATLNKEVGEELEFTNVYNPADVDIIKTQAVNDGNPTTELLTVRENDKVTYYLQAVNKGAGKALNVVITDVVPEGLTLVAEENPAYSVGEDGKTLTWTIGELAPGAEQTVTFTVKVPDVTVDTSWKNMATVVFNDPGETPDDPTTPDESEEVEIEEGVPEVDIVKTQTVGETTDTLLSVKAGDRITYTITVTNSGTEEADDVVIKDKVPAGLTVETIHDGGVNNNGTITWNIGTLAENASETVSFTVVVESTEEEFTEWTNIATVDYPNDPEDPNDEEDEPSDPVTVYDSLEAYLVGKKTVEVSEGSNHELGTFNFVLKAVTEGAPMPAPENTTVSNDENGVIVFGPIKYDKAGTYVYQIGEEGAGETIDGVLHDDSLYFAKVVVDEIVETATDEEGNVTSTSTSYEVKSITYHKDSQDAEAEDTFEFVNIYNDADVEIVKTQAVNGGNATTDKLTVREGEEVTYFLTVTNNGLGKALDVTITDIVPAGLIVDEIHNGGEDADGTITWTVAELEAGATETVSFTVIVPEVSKEQDTDNDGYVEWKNIAAVVYNNPDDPEGDDPEEDEPDEPVVIEEGIPEVSIKKLQAVNDGPYTEQLIEVIKDDKVTYLIQVTNSGTEVAEGIVITDEIPEGLEVIKDSISEGGSYKDGTITWTIDKVEGLDAENNPGTAVVSFTVTVPSVTAEEAGEDGKYTWENIAAFIYENDPEEPEEPEPSDPVEIEEGVPELVVDKMADKQKVEAGDVVKYSISVKNTGTGLAKGIKVIDTLPEGLIIDEESISDNGIYDEGAGTITWSLEQMLAVGEEVTVGFKVTVPNVTTEEAGEDGIYEWKNIATVVFDNDPDPEEPGDDEEIIEEGIAIVDAVKTQAVNGGNPTTERVEVVAGNEVTYYITVTNAGTVAAKDIVIEDEIEEGLLFVENSISEGGILKDGTITWNIFELAGLDEEGNPGTITVSFTVRVPEVYEETVWENIATVDYSNDPDDPDDEDKPEPTNPVEAEEEPIGPVDTGDNANITLYVVLAAGALAAIAAVFIIKRKRR